MGLTLYQLCQMDPAVTGPTAVPSPLPAVGPKSSLRGGGPLRWRSEPNAHGTYPISIDQAQRIMAVPSPRCVSSSDALKKGNFSASTGIEPTTIHGFKRRI